MDIEEVPLSAVRPLLTKLIEKVNETETAVCLTNNGRPRAYLVSPDVFNKLKDL